MKFGGWLASLTQQRWVWANSGRWWRTGKPGVRQSRGSPRHDQAPERQAMKLEGQQGWGVLNQETEGKDKLHQRHTVFLDFRFSFCPPFFSVCAWQTPPPGKPWKEALGFGRGPPHRCQWRRALHWLKCRRHKLSGWTQSPEATAGWRWATCPRPPWLWLQVIPTKEPTSLL